MNRSEDVSQESIIAGTTAAFSGKGYVLSRIVRLNAQMTPSERKEFQEIIGASAGQTAQALLDAFDPDVIAAHAGVSLPEDLDLSPFDHRDGLGRFYEVFGEESEKILMVLDVGLVA